MLEAPSVGGFVLGLVDGLSAGYGFPEWTDAYSLVVMIVILIVRPQGLFGGTLGPRSTSLSVTRTCRKDLNDER